MNNPAKNNLRTCLTLFLLCAVSACGGGGGSAGTVAGGSTGGGATASKVASIVLIASAGSILASGGDGTEVTLTAVVKDANNSVLVGETVDFTASSGAISNTTRLTDSTGSVIEKLSVKGDPSLRDITITASVGTLKSAAIIVKVVPITSSIASLLLTSSSGTMQSIGSTDVNIIALVKDASNAVVQNTIVNFSADSGALSQTTATTNAKGLAIVTLNTGGDASLRTINVTANATGNQASTLISVIGTKLTVNASSSINLGASTDMTVKLVDSSGTALVGKPVIFSARINPVTVKGGGASPTVTDVNGQVILTYLATSGNSDTVTVKAMGDTVTAGLTINASNFSVNVINGSTALPPLADVNVCQRIAIHNDTAGVPQTGSVSVSTSRGTIYSDSSCATPLVGAPIAFIVGNANAYIRATGPGVASLTATASVTGTSVQGTVEFVAPLVASATINVQANPAVVGTNSNGSTTQQSTLRAVVRDGTVQNNLVKNAHVSFAIQTDPSGGFLTSPSVVITGSDGSASVNYIAGNTTTPIGGVVIQAQIQEVVSTAFNTATLTVAKKSLFIAAGTGNIVITPSDATYRKDYVVFVTDAAGNAVADVDITASVRPRNYYKGFMVFPGTTGPWTPNYTATCLNEDADNTGLLGNQDFNGNGRLDPGIPLAFTPAGRTDISGMTTVSLTYPRDRAYWVDVDFTIRGQVSGTESTYVGYTLLPGASSDYIDSKVSPPGVVSPYGTASLCNNKN
jgi:hypothetical protein